MPSDVVRLAEMIPEALGIKANRDKTDYIKWKRRKTEEITNSVKRQSRAGEKYTCEQVHV